MPSNVSVNTDQPRFSGEAKVNYLCTLRFEPSMLAGLASAYDEVEVLQIPADRAEEIPADVWAQVDVLHTYGAIPELSAAPRLRWVQTDTSGVDHLRTTPIWDCDIPITTIGGISPVPLAEYVIFAILGTAHHLPELLEVQKSREWPTPADRWDRMLPVPVRGATLGIVGYGRIGREIGRLAGALGMHVLGLSRTAGQRTPLEQYGAAAAADAGTELLGPDRLGELMERSDFVVVVVPLTEATAGMVDADQIGRMKQGAVLINVARGGIVDETALRSALRSGRVRAAVLDVFDAEPLGPEDSWWDEDRVFITPHVSGLAPAYATGVLEIVAENLQRFVEGRPMLNEVDRAHGY